VEERGLRNPPAGLTLEDYRLLHEMGRIREFPANAVILREGDLGRTFFVILRGSCRVERAHFGRGITIATMGPQELFGEMSFLEGAGASASVVAEGPTEVLAITPDELDTLLQSVPGLAARFYQHLALNLSRRLRDRTAMLPPLLIEEVASVRPFPLEHTGHADSTRLPPSLIEDVERFKSAMLAIGRDILNPEADATMIAERVAEVCDAVVMSLHSHVRRHEVSEVAIGSYVRRETFPYLMSARFNDRANTKPRGYAGDYRTIELLYANEPAGDGRLGPHIDRWVMNAPSSRAVRNRREMIRGMAREMQERWTRSEPMRLCSLACGPAREIFDLLEGDAAANIHATCLDIDPEAVTFVRAIAEEKGVADHITLVVENLIRLAQGRGRVQVGEQDLIYSMGLIDYLQDEVVVALLDWCHDTLAPGGSVALGNFASGNPDKGYLDHVLEWVLIHRSPEDLRKLFVRSRFGSAPVEIRRDETGVQLMAVACKR
jgi:CRP-like cAMP-binding protein/SAM-dependent methyltransferase